MTSIVISFGYIFALLVLTGLLAIAHEKIDPQSRAVNSFFEGEMAPLMLLIAITIVAFVGWGAWHVPMELHYWFGIEPVGWAVRTAQIFGIPLSLLLLRAGMPVFVFLAGAAILFFLGKLLFTFIFDLGM